MAFQGFEIRAVRNLSHISDSSLAAMAQIGFAGRTIDGETIQLHHHRQNPDGPIIELPESMHNIGNRNQHPFGNEAGSGLTAEQRQNFNNWRVEYWKARAEAEIFRRTTGQ